MNDFDGLLTSKYGFKTSSATSPSSFELGSIYDKPPVYDRHPVYDDDIFEGVPWIKTTSSSSSYSGFGFGYDREDVTAAGKKGKEAGDRGGGGTGGGAAFDDL